ncbi:MAG TPA: RNA-binding protein [Bacillales bacterium]|nr:RNA-binding protein [Bacillales bacterium]
MDVYQHFRSEEKPFIDEVTDWKAAVKETFVPKRTDFLNPREQRIVQSLIGSDDDLELDWNGGVPNSERKRLLVLPPYHPPQERDHGLVLFSVEYPRKFASVKHRDLLGALMSLGLKRSKFGDLLFKDGDVQFVAAEEVAAYIRMNLSEVGRFPVELKEQSFEQGLRVEKRWKKKTGTVSSLRLDTVLAEIYRLPRSKVAPLIEKGRVKVNWKVTEQASFLLEEGDELSVRGRGRSKLFEIEGRTKKGKWKVVVGEAEEDSA